MGKVLARVILIAVLLVAPTAARSDSRLDSAIASIGKIVDGTSVSKTTEPPKEIGVPASEVLSGNGSRAGYVLGHGNIIPGSEWVWVGVKRARANVDYTIDYSSGSLFFAEAVRQSDSVKVDYSYSDKAKGERSVTGPGAMALGFGNSLQTNLTYSYRAADPAKAAGVPDILTYGLNSTTSLWGSSALKSMFYVATPQNPNRLSLTSTQTTPAQQATAPKVKKDRLIMQEADFGVGGKARLKLRFQDVGRDFAGMSSLRDSRAASDDVLNQLEKERGIQRRGADLEIPTGRAGSLSFSNSRISDPNGSITSNVFGYNGSAIKFGYSTRSIGRGFTRFKDIKEADAAQMAAEAGTNRTSYSMQIKTGTGPANAAVWSGINVTRLQSETGDLTYKTIDLDSGKISVQADIRTIDPGFNSMTALTDAERSRMAQLARRQFDPAAPLSQVTAQDKAQVNNEVGLNRKDYAIRYDGWLSIGMGSVEAPNGGSLDTTSFRVGLRNGSVGLYHHRIDKSFDKLGVMQPVELAHFGNEYGMSRTDMDGNYKLKFGDLAVAHGIVTDYQGASVRRHSVDFRNTRLKFRANFQDIDARFSRTNDLSDGDKTMLAQELGFRRSDYRFKIDVTRNLSLDSYFYDSTNVTAEQTRSQTRHNITYSPQRGPRITALSDTFSYISDAGNLSSYSHKKITFDNKFNFLGGLLFKGMNDTNTDQESSNDPTTTTINQMHLETNQNAATSYSIDSLRTDYGDGHRFEDNWEFGAKRRVGRNLALTGAYSRTAREDDKSETNGRFGFEWSPKKDLTMGVKVANRDGGPDGSQQAKEFSVKGSVAKRLLFFDNVTVDSGTNTTELKGKQTACDNGLKVNAGFLGGNATFDNSDKLNAKTGVYYTSRIQQYESSKDPRKRYHLTFFRQQLTTPAGDRASRRNYALELRLSRNTGCTFTSYFGKDGQNGAVLPVGGTVFKISRAVGANTTLFADYTDDLNETTRWRARIAGLGFAGTLSNNAAVEFYFGWSNMIEDTGPTHDNVFRIKYDRKLNADHYISLSAQKKSGVDRSTINPFEGNTTARIDFKSVFH